MIDTKITPLIEAIINFSPDRGIPAGLQNLSTQEMVEAIENFSDEEILCLSIERPGHKGQFGFILNPRVFESLDQFAAVMCALQDRFAKAKERNKDWQNYIIRKSK